MNVVVGVDGSPRSVAAIQLAAQEAGYRKIPLVAVMAYSGDSALGAPATRPVATLRTAAEVRAAAEAELEDAVEEALGEAAQHAELRVVTGMPGRKLVDVAREMHAELVVLASRGSASLLLGTVSQYVLRNAPCPVVVVPPACVPAGQRRNG